MNHIPKTPWNKGKKMPHSDEWERNRIESVRIAAAKRKGIPTGRKPTPKVAKALKDWKIENREMANQIAISNLPKDCNGSKNGNWKGGITKLKRGLRFSREYKAWRASILSRDESKCRLCGCTNRLQAHHIVSVKEFPAFAFSLMNGVTLCKDCHYKNDKVWQGERPKEIQLTRNNIFIYTIPHKFQEYDTVGNWQFLKDGTLVIFVSEMKDWRSEFAVAIHELAEAKMCQHRGISGDAVTAFDLQYERDRKGGLHSETDEPGEDKNAPYFKEHVAATFIEREICSQLDLPWVQHEGIVNETL